MPKERAPISTRLRNKDKNIGTIALAKEAPLGTFGLAYNFNS